MVRLSNTKAGGARLYDFRVWRYSRGGWTLDGTPLKGQPAEVLEAERRLAEQRNRCTHAGPCRFPFKQCDGGMAAMTEEVCE